jgi:hypothetical protein
VEWIRASNVLWFNLVLFVYAPKTQFFVSLITHCQRSKCTGSGEVDFSNKWRCPAAVFILDEQLVA